jgi:anti-repressor protein
MPNLVPLSELFTDPKNLNSVDAKKLHEALGVKSKFYDWINPKIKDYKQDVDYVRLFSKSLITKEPAEANYILNFKLAKKFAMMTRSKKGEEVRDYFLECEEKLIIELPLLKARIERIEEQLRNKKATHLHKVLIGYQENIFGIREPIYSKEPMKQSDCTPIQIAEHYTRGSLKQANTLITNAANFFQGIKKLGEKK